jgi:hypothetical protein
MAIEKYAEEWLEREFVGYGMDQPNPEWPGGAKVCVSFLVQYYMGAVSTRRLSREFTNVHAENSIGVICSQWRRELMRRLLRNSEDSIHQRPV